MKRAGWWLLLILALLGVATYQIEVPSGSAEPVFVEIPPGTGTAGIARRLHEAGVIHSEPVFKLYRLFRGGTLRAGEYRFDHPLRLRDVYTKIALGEVYTLTVVVPEGFNIFDVAGAVERAGLGSASTFLAAERSETALIRDLSPQATSLEGYLYPDTYRFSRHATPDLILRAMVHRFRQAAALLQLEGPGTARIVTLASLIEKEVSVDAERGLVSGVFENRMAQNMPLATDPTVIYAAMLNDRWRGTIYQSDLQFDSPYNTYRHTGLPPGPIANPGLAALKAALHPAHTDFLYFVADAQGHSRFAKDLRGHAEQVQQYRQAQRGAITKR